RRRPRARRRSGRSRRSRTAWGGSLLPSDAARNPVLPGALQGFLPPAAPLVQLDPEILRRDLAPERAQDEVPRARVAVLERGARDEALDHREDVAPRGRRPRDLLAEHFRHGGSEELPALARQRSPAALALAEPVLDEQVGQDDARGDREVQRG